MKIYTETSQLDLEDYLNSEIDNNEIFKKIISKGGSIIAHKNDFNKICKIKESGKFSNLLIKTKILCDKTEVVKEHNPIAVLRGNEILGNNFHDEGAYGRCSYCLRYSDNYSCLNRGFKCDCGKKNGFSGSFEKPDLNSIWDK